MLQFRVKLDASFEKRFQELGPFLAQRFYEELIQNIKSNKYGFANAPATLKKKGSKLPMIDTGEYVKHISVEGNKVLVQDGEHVGGISFNELANILEYGRLDKGFTGFPVWRRTLEDFKKELPALVRKFVKLGH